MEIIVNDVTKSNFVTLWPSMMLAIKTSNFIAVDLELSGLGDRKQLTASSIDIRYTALCDIAKSRSIISFGLACFHQIPSKEVSHQLAHEVQVFNLFLLCDDDYVVESQSLQFLVKHGFDFNKQYSSGISYKRGNQQKIDQHPSIRRLFLEIVLANVPLIFHNGFIDLVFMYQCFYSDLPSSLQTFLADVNALFPNGIYDTKYISEYHTREKLSVLEYLFRKCQHSNESSRLGGKQFVTMQSKVLYGNGVDEEIVSCILPSVNVTETCKSYLPQLCNSFKERGYCSVENSCKKIHSVDLIIISEESEQKKKSRRRSKKRRRESEGTCTKDSPGVDENCHHEGDNEMSGLKKARKENSEAEITCVNEKDTLLMDPFVDISLPRMKGHRAGFDSFMTGYCFACYQNVLNSTKDSTIEDTKNKVYLSAKDMPLTIMKSHFVKTSNSHRKIMADLVK